MNISFDWLKKPLTWIKVAGVAVGGAAIGGASQSLLGYMQSTGGHTTSEGVQGAAIAGAIAGIAGLLIKSPRE